MIILYKGKYNRDIISDLLNLVQDIKPNWTFSFKEYKSEADVQVIEYKGDNLESFSEDLTNSTGGLVIGVKGRDCFSECPKDFNAGIVDVRDHIRVYTQGKN